MDEVLGDRLPTLADRSKLPYVNAFCSEVMRWRPPLPLGVPHAALEDDVYGDYFIPKGAVIIADSWCALCTLLQRISLNLPIRQILRDKKYGPNPEEFIPERFLQPGIRPPVEHFGFGRRHVHVSSAVFILSLKFPLRRICPGRFFANNTFFLIMASMIKVFNIAPMKDENGIDIPVSDAITESSLP